MGEKTKSSQCVEIEPLVTWNSQETYRSMLLNVDAGVFQELDKGGCISIQGCCLQGPLNWLGACIKHSGSLGLHFLQSLLHNSSIHMQV